MPYYYDITNNNTIACYYDTPLWDQLRYKTDVFN